MILALAGRQLRLLRWLLLSLSLGLVGLEWLLVVVVARIETGPGIAFLQQFLPPALQAFVSSQVGITKLSDDWPLACCAACACATACSMSAEYCSGVITPPRYSPAGEMASKVVAVPKSTITAGTPYPSTAATPLTIRSAPTSCGLS